MLSQYTKIRVAIAVAICVVLIGVFLFLHRDRAIKVASFDACVEAGYAVIDSLPARCLDSESTVHTEDVGNIIEMQNEIRITAPVRNTLMTSPLIITGEAQQNWFAEGKIRAVLIDTAGIVLGSVALEIEKGNETEDFRRFSGKIEWKLRDTDALKGNIVLKKTAATDTQKEIRMPVFLRLKN